MAVAAPSVTGTSARLSGRMARHPWLSAAWTAARTPRGGLGLGLAAAMTLLSLIGPLLAPRSPDALVTLTFAKPSGNLPLGSDYLGRDVLSRVLDGGWV